MRWQFTGQCKRGRISMKILIYGAGVIGGKQHEKRRIQKTVNC